VGDSGGVGGRDVGDVVSNGMVVSRGIVASVLRGAAASGDWAFGQAYSTPGWSPSTR